MAQTDFQFGFRVVVWQYNPTKGWIGSGTVYGDMHYKDLLGTMVRVGHCIPVSDFLSRATWLSIPNKHCNGLINQSINPFYIDTQGI